MSDAQVSNIDVALQTCKWCSNTVSNRKRQLCQRHYLALIRNGACVCGRPWLSTGCKDLTELCVCGAKPPEKKKRPREGAPKRVQVIRESQVAARMRRLSELGARADHLLKQLDALFDAASIELGEELRRSASED